MVCNSFAKNVFHYKSKSGSYMSIEFISKFTFEKSDFMLCKHNNPLSSIKFPIHLRMCIMQLENMTSTVLCFVQFL